MNRHVIAAIVRRDLTAVQRTPAVLVPMAVLPLVTVAVFPLIASVVSRADSAHLPTGSLDEIMPGSIAAMSDAQPVQLALLLSMYLFPTILVVVPLMVVSVIATDSIAGERERGTLEGLLLTPASDTELLVGKLLSSALPAIAIHLCTSVLYAVAINGALAGHVDGLILPSLPWLTIVLWVAPAFAAVMLGLSVLVSARSRSVQGASQLTGVAVLPLVMMVIGQVAGVALLSGIVAIAIGAVLWVGTIVLLRLGSRQMARHRLAAAL